MSDRPRQRHRRTASAILLKKIPLPKTKTEAGTESKGEICLKPVTIILGYRTTTKFPTDLKDELSVSLQPSPPMPQARY